MKITRYIGKLENSTPVVFTDFLVVGGGIAGLFTALKASAYGKVTVLTKKNRCRIQYRPGPGRDCSCSP
jgi:L-aspartate oxidase